MSPSKICRRLCIRSSSAWSFFFFLFPPPHTKIRNIVAPYLSIEIPFAKRPHALDWSLQEDSSAGFYSQFFSSPGGWRWSAARPAPPAARCRAPGKGCTDETLHPGEDPATWGRTNTRKDWSYNRTASFSTSEWSRSSHITLCPSHCTLSAPVVSDFIVMPMTAVCSLQCNS